MKKLTGKQIRAGAAGILFAAAVICYSMGIGRGTDVRERKENEVLTEVSAGGRPEEEAGREDSSAGERPEGEAGREDSSAGGRPEEAGWENSFVEENPAEEGETQIYIHVCGAVVNPGVYAFAEGSRACEAVEAAGGLREDAAETAVNLARILTDGQQLWIPTKEEVEAAGLSGTNPAGAEMWPAGQERASGTGAAAEAASGKVNLNTASKETLMTLTGIGEARAEAIIAYRRDAGPFLVIEDIMKVSGIKEAAFQKIKDDITV